MGIQINPPDNSRGGPVWKPHYTPNELTVASCPVCGATTARDIAREFGIAICRCHHCGLFYTRTPLPDPQLHYRVSGEDALEKYGPIFRGERAHPRDQSYEEHLRLLEAVVSGRKLLDVGCHAGFFLLRARERGWRTTGVEPSPATSMLAREHLGLNVITGALPDAEFARGSFDAVTMLDVLEHVAQPRALLVEVHRILRPRGLVFVKVPNIRYVLAKHYLLRPLPGAVEDVFDAREHLAYYSHATLSQLLEFCGFQVERMVVPSPIQTGGPIRRALRTLGPAIARRLPRGVALPLATDIVALARKPEFHGAATLGDSHACR